MSAGIVADYIAYRRDAQWWSKLSGDIYIGMPVTALRKYLTDDGIKHGITGLVEYNRSEGHWFVFHNHNNSILFRAMHGGIDDLLQGGVAVWLDQNDNVKNIHTFE